ncbi:N-acetylmuramoyl-L-alanine amidase [Aestuariicella sp. G3-2]|uniref:N-acetylmuramoyl-L-alanine amidase n=1 Tax=Pseudomaricurvus albidus TaxID=2842452 RepID=UPI001C0AA9D6|nr:N-acetylmuramoyl-L-alanine amidase [Aestuariicella albida]MBU3068340.1 N-acetylmuramoyl-L-alanine amidase [Aestuariicella albida]
MLLVFLVCSSFGQVISAAVQVESVRLWRAPDSTRLVFDLSATVQHKLFSLSNPSRLVIDIENTRLGTSFADLPLTDTPIRGIRSAERNGKDLRVVLDLSASIKPKSFVLPKHGDKNDRLVIDLFDRDKPVEKTVEKLVSTHKGKRDIIIAIDAGHGGEDPGASGPKIKGRHLREKDVVLAISKQLAAMINAEPGYRAELVRTGDYYIPLRKRRDIAREKRADLFVSIHADAFKNPRASGASVFALSRSGATSETARFLAQQENEADLIGGVGGVSLDDKDEVLRGVLVDLSMTATLGSSLQVGDKVLKSMGTFAHLHKHQVEQAGFAVLKSPDVPSILVETGFISNPGEANKLNSYAYRQRLSTAIFKGIKQHFYAVPPAGSYVAYLKYGGKPVASSKGMATEHVISRGDTLSGIARQYDVTVGQIQKANRMTNSTIRIGQKLKIPAS